MNTSRTPLTPAERTARDADRRTHLDHTLMDGVQAVIDSDSFKAVLAANARFHTYSATNAMLIWLQRPTAEQVAGFHTWKKLGRTVKKGEKGIMIYAPRIKKAATDGDDPTVFFGIEHVFALDQTEGDDLPSVDVPPLTEDSGHAVYGRLTEYADTHGLHVTTTPTHDVPADAMGYYHRATNEIWVRPSAMSQMLKTLIHELAHYVDFKREEPISREERETIAEGVAYQVCAHVGIDTAERSFPYIATWACHDGGVAVIKRVLGHIQAITKQVIMAISSTTPDDAASSAPVPAPPSVVHAPRRRAA